MAYFPSSLETLSENWIPSSLETRSRPADQAGGERLFKQGNVGFALAKLTFRVSKRGPTGHQIVGSCPPWPKSGQNGHETGLESTILGSVAFHRKPEEVVCWAQGRYGRPMDPRPDLGFA